MNDVNQEITYWELLKLEPTHDKKAIRNAYSNRLPEYHPEDDPEGFQRLKAAYQQAMAYAQQEPETIITSENISSYNENTVLFEQYTKMEQAMIYQDGASICKNWGQLTTMEEEDQEQWNAFLQPQLWGDVQLTLQQYIALFEYEFQKSYDHSHSIASKISMRLKLQDHYESDPIYRRLLWLLKQDAKPSNGGFLAWKQGILKVCNLVTMYSKHNYSIEMWQEMLTQNCIDSSDIELRYRISKIVESHVYSEPIWNFLKSTFAIENEATQFTDYKPEVTKESKRTRDFRMAFIWFAFSMFMLTSLLSLIRTKEKNEFQAEQIKESQEFTQESLKKRNEELQNKINELVQNSDDIDDNDESN